MEEGSPLVQALAERFAEGMKGTLLLGSDLLNGGMTAPEVKGKPADPFPDSANSSMKSPEGLLDGESLRALPQTEVQSNPAPQPIPTVPTRRLRGRPPGSRNRKASPPENGPPQ